MLRTCSMKTKMKRREHRNDSSLEWCRHHIKFYTVSPRKCVSEDSKIYRGFRDRQYTKLRIKVRNLQVSARKMQTAFRNARTKLRDRRHSDPLMARIVTDENVEQSRS